MLRIWAKSLPPAVANMKNVNCVSNDGEKNSVGTNSFAINQLANLDVKRFALLGQRASLRKILQAVNCDLETIEPFRGAFGRALRNPQIRLVHFRNGGRLDDDAVFHSLAGILCLRLSRANAVFAGTPSPRAKLSRPSLIPAMASACSTESSKR